MIELIVINQRKSLLPVLFIAALPLIVCVGCCSIYWWGVSSKTDDTADYIIDYSAILGDDWQTTAARESKYCGAGWCFGASDSGYRHTQNQLAFVDQSVSIYAYGFLANDAYDNQVKFFSRHYSARSEDIEVQFADSIFKADKHFVRCVQFIDQDIVKDTQCSALFLHGNYLVIINMWPRRDFEDYISWDQIEAMLHLSDNRIVEARRLG